jgi:hypothetical protein
MDENLTIWVERIFNISYLVVTCVLLISMIRRRGDVALKDCKAAALVTWSFAF